MIGLRILPILLVISSKVLSMQYLPLCLLAVILCSLSLAFICGYLLRFMLFLLLLLSWLSLLVLSRCLFDMNTSKIFYFKFLLIFVVLFSIILSFPCFAYSYTSDNGLDFTGQPIPVVSSSMSSSNRYSLGLDAFIFEGKHYHISSTSPVYAFFFSWSDGRFGLCFCSENQNVTGYCSSYVGSVSESSRLLNEYDSSNRLYWTIVQVFSHQPETINIPYFRGRGSGNNAVRDWIDNPPVPTPPSPPPSDDSPISAFTSFLSDCWRMFEEVNVPVLDISFAKLYLGVFVVCISIIILRPLLGIGGSGFASNIFHGVRGAAKRGYDNSYSKYKRSHERQEKFAKRFKEEHKK